MIEAAAVAPAIAADVVAAQQRANAAVAIAPASSWHQYQK
jgi:hypothetical protein